MNTYLTANLDGSYNSTRIEARTYAEAETQKPEGVRIIGILVAETD